MTIEVFSRTRLPRLNLDSCEFPVPESLGLEEIFGALSAKFRPAWMWNAPSGAAEICLGAAARIGGDSQVTLTASESRAVIALEAAGEGDRFARTDELLHELWDRCDDPDHAAAVGGASFAPGPHMAAPWSYFPRISFVVPAVRIRLVRGIVHVGFARIGDAASPLHNEHRLRRLIAESARCNDEPGSFTVQATLPRDSYEAAVRTTVDSIERGDLNKLVLARSVEIEANRAFDVASVAARLGKQNPACTAFAVTDGGGTFLGATPETLLRVRDGHCESRPLAGTVRAGTEISEIERDKLTREHRLLANAVVETMTPACGNLTFDAEPAMQTFGGISHLATRVEGTMKPGVTALALIGALHPTPAVGADPAGAIAALGSLETFERGWYAGVIARVGPTEADAVLALRCGLVRGKRATIYAGCGIVAGSDPATEFEESRLKMRPMLDALVTT